jgi:hypothetical protein
MVPMSHPSLSRCWDRLKSPVLSERLVSLLISSGPDPLPPSALLDMASSGMHRATMLEWRWMAKGQRRPNTVGAYTATIS